MKKLIFIGLLLASVFPVKAQEYAEKTKDDSNYLAGAVTQNAEGNIEWTEDISTGNLSANEIRSRLLKWNDERRTLKNKISSVVAYNDSTQNIIVLQNEEWIVFADKALSLDRSRIYYRLTFTFGNNKLNIKMNHIHYWYDENREGGERWKAEEIICDEYALNRSKTKLTKGIGKFRRQTINLKDALFERIKSIF